MKESQKYGWIFLVYMFSFEKFSAFVFSSLIFNMDNTQGINSLKILCKRLINLVFDVCVLLCINLCQD